MAGISLGTTDVKICARALVNIAMQPIDNLDGDDDVTSTCALMYPMVKKEILSAYPWYATVTKKQLGRLTDSPVNEWKYAFNLPSGRLGGPLAVFCSGDEGATSFTGWDVQGALLLSNEPSIWIECQFDIDESKFPPYLENLCIYALSARLAEILTDDSQKADKYDFIAYGTPSEKRWGGYFEVARSIDSRYKTNKAITGFSLVNVRGT